MDAFWAAPPVIRYASITPTAFLARSYSPISSTLTAAVVITSLAVHGSVLSAHTVIYHWSFLTKFPPQLYRLATAFWLTGPSLSIIFDPYFCKLVLAAAEE